MDWGETALIRQIVGCFCKRGVAVADGFCGQIQNRLCRCIRYSASALSNGMLVSSGT